MTPLVHLPLRRSSDVALAREKARVAARMLGLDGLAQIRVATATSELARAVIEVGAGGEFAIEQLGSPESLVFIFRGKSGKLVRQDASWDPLRSAQLCADQIAVDREPAWPIVARFIKHVPATTSLDFDALRIALGQDDHTDAITALTQQNRELAKLLDQLREHDAERARVNAELVAANSTVAAANARLQALARRKDELLATITHDLRSPLSAVRGAIDLLVDGAGGALSQQQERFLNIADRALQHILELVNDLLDSALLDAGLLRLEKRRISLDEVLAQTRSTIAFLAQEKGIQFLVDVPLELQLDADPVRLPQVLQNLLSNAIKFTSPGGTVSLRARLLRSEVQLEVSDNGVGIPPDRIPTLFDKYQRSHTRGTRGEKGTGLGLLICRQLIEMHGGALTLQSELGQGTRCAVTLPCPTP